MLSVDKSGRFLCQQDGQPFFYLGDTAWELFHKLNREDADFYLRNRARKGFSVIQAVILAEFNGLTEPNAYGHLPLVETDPARPVEEYFEHVDWIVDKTRELGMYVGMLPTWGDKIVPKWGPGPEIFTEDNALVFGKFLAKRYKGKNIIWILGGDRIPEEPKHYLVYRAMAQGIRENCDQLITYHPLGQQTAGDYFFDDDWLDFVGLQSGHFFSSPNYQTIARDYARTPPKPCIDLEPGYENLPSFNNAAGEGVGFKKEHGYLDAYETRKACYWALFAGAMGHTYGCNEIFHFYVPDESEYRFDARIHWKEALNLPGASQMIHARKLLESRPYFSRIPDNTLISSGALDGHHRLQATRDAEGTYALIYTAYGDPFVADTSKLSCTTLRSAWFNPRSGSIRKIRKFPNSGSQSFVPPSQGTDWVLILDDVSKRYSFPA